VLVARFKRSALTALVCAGLTACADLSVISGDERPQVDGLRQAARGTGFFIGPESVLTNFHVVSRCSAVTVGNNFEGKEVAAMIIAHDEMADLAVLSAAASDVTPARFKTTVDTDTAQTWAIVGYPAVPVSPVPAARLDRIWIDPIDFLGEPKTIPFSGAVERGNSGSPVLDNVGSIVGIVFAKLDSQKVYESTGAIINDVGVAIPNRVVFDFLRANAIAFEPAMSTRRRSQEELLNEAHGFVRQVICWR
jgi:S1-C subfamily serine protease